MCASDISHGDFNPTLLYIHKFSSLRGKCTPHRHDCMEICFVLSGKCGFEINHNFSIGETGDIIFLNPRILHNEVLIDEEGVILLFLGLTDFHLLNMENNHISFYEDTPIIHTEGEARQSMLSLCYKMLDENEQNSVGKYFMMRSYLAQFILSILRLKDESEVTRRNETFQYYSHKKSHIIKQTIDYLENHYTEKISLDQISQNVYVSPVYISKVFKQETGASPISYLINIRLERAKKLLETNPDMSIQEAASLVGYEDTYHFSKLFKKHYGHAPSHYKAKKNSGNEDFRQ